jgi:hypothetical protein
MRPGNRIASAVTAAVLASAALLPAGHAVAASPAVLWVSPSGSDSATGTQAWPLRTLQQALDEAGPGTRIHLQAGSYSQDVTTRTDGTASQRIVIQGPSSGTATLSGTGHIVAIRNSYYTLEGFTIDGQPAIESIYPVATWPDTASGMASFKSQVSPLARNDKLIYIDSGSAAAGVTGTVVNHMTLTGSGGECVRIRNGATRNLIENSVIRYCGMYPDSAAGAFPYHNGEGVYIGTSPKSTGLADAADDESSGNVVRDDIITTYAAECFDVKENAHGNTLSGSTCAGNEEPSSDGGSDIELRGYLNTITGDQIGASTGYGIKVGSDTPSEDLGRNTLMGNTFTGESGGALSDRSTARFGRVCGNVVQSGGIGDFTRFPRYSGACPARGQPAAAAVKAGR